MRKAELSTTVGTELSPGWWGSEAAAVLPTRDPERPKPLQQRDVSRQLARVKRAMVSILKNNPDADLVGPSACTLVANAACVAPGTASDWFSGTGRPLRYRLHDLLPEATTEADQER